MAWQKSMEFAAEIYRCTKKLPDDERYGMTSQLRRAAVSIASNIAEGQGRQSTGEFRQFLGHARGSLLETETQVLLAQKLHYLMSSDAEHLLELSAELGKVLNGLIGSLQEARR